MTVLARRDERSRHVPVVRVSAVVVNAVTPETARRPSSSSRLPRSSGLRPITAARTRRSSLRMVSICPLKSWRCSWMVAAYRAITAASSSSISCRRTRSMVKPSPITPTGSVRSISRSCAPGQELVGRHAIQLGEPEQPGHRDRPLPPLVGAEDRRLELLIGPGLHIVEGQALLPSNCPKAFADVTSVYPFHTRSLGPLLRRPGPYH